MVLSMPSQRLLDWFDVNERDLPWRRRDASAWHILVSEFMPSRPRSPASCSRGEQWIRRWPTPADMAAADGADVIRAWGSWAILAERNGCTRAPKPSPPNTTMSFPTTSMRCWRCPASASTPPRGRLLRLRTAGAGRRHQRAAGDSARLPRTRRCTRAATLRSRRCVGDRAADRRR